MAQNRLLCYLPHCSKRSLTHRKIVSTSTLLWEEDLLRTRPRGSWLSLMLTPLSPSDVVLGCSGRPVSDGWLSQCREREL